MPIGVYKKSEAHKQKLRESNVGKGRTLRDRSYISRGMKGNKNRLGKKLNPLDQREKAIKKAAENGNPLKWLEDYL